MSEAGVRAAGRRDDGHKGKLNGVRQPQRQMSITVAQSTPVGAERTEEGSENQVFQ